MIFKNIGLSAKIDLGNYQCNFLYTLLGWNNRNLSKNQ